MRDPGRNIEIRAMQMNAESKLRHHPGARRRGSSVKAQLIKLAVLITLMAAFFWWIYS